MSVVIRGMEMPKACWECPLKVHLFQQLWCVPSDKVINRDDNTKREPDCPLIPLPSEHGRLIDADTLYSAIVEAGQANKGKRYRVGDIWELNGAEIREVINSMPTIVDAERSDT